MGPIKRPKPQISDGLVASKSQDPNENLVELDHDYTSSSKGNYSNCNIFRENKLRLFNGSST